ncbi:MAG: hypothetical protein ACFFFC_00875 [Candidatus Thorarchaeota archaeon]
MSDYSIHINEFNGHKHYFEFDNFCALNNLMSKIVIEETKEIIIRNIHEYAMYTGGWCKGRHGQNILLNYFEFKLKRNRIMYELERLEIEGQNNYELTIIYNTCDRNYIREWKFSLEEMLEQKLKALNLYHAVEIKISNLNANKGA